MILSYRPLQTWGREPSKGRRANPYRSDWAGTLRMLDTELGHLKASAVVLQLDVTEADIRLDGVLRANVQPAFPGVRLIADTPQGTLAWQTDSCARWRHNVHSIALGLESLRAVDRYGITHSGEQYKGWLQIESGGPLATLAAIAGVPVVEGAEAAIWRKARAAAHPDRHGGRRELWDQVEAAARALGLEAG